MNVKIEADESIEEENEKMKQRLEKRFPGLIVSYNTHGQEEKNAVLHTD
ncbi:MAG: hypothetical protein AWM53_01051 [Candidatus Dichloromethanomonas elyunquensis]|nr:MAG: hypothetical protein AWM53_01051 [Candidatus Dichloromethanomonas elyunquensis]